ncbi:MAG TPA: AmmeMemoRadiSam system protein B [Caldisericia bacterium]|nr:MAG: hypothetical protein BWX90_00832 [bacterium ADurb.Bin132]HOG71074.1 AmmeMemoRadiSam system protein B [Caldisericia bacterium]HQL68821.1 AmmeMemoRadiSam system protein B [Caldisericia bacterium]
MVMDRKPYVAGRFYPDDPQKLGSMLESFFEVADTKAAVPSIIVPHAGYMYSGKVAGAVYSKIAVPEIVVIIGPNHTGLGAPISIWPDGSWETPLGNVPVDNGTIMALLNNSRHAKPDTQAHLNEHSIEVQIPFLQYCKKGFKIVPIAMGDYSIEAIEDLANALDKATSGKEVLFVASSDFSHYEPEYTAKARDRMAIDEIKKLDWMAMLRVVAEKEITMCGAGPIAVATELAKRRGATSGKLLAYSNSGVMSHDFSNVVTYAGMAFR